ncbi:uncharacterized protein LOC143284310 isoform X2 [Babylonia areolata]|uniref:uncharacterized protein LOC143284310 isoform X2 n=1 Tax=Babylonia areolata TaxID=304850 RepID=UPI003FD29C27
MGCCHKRPVLMKIGEEIVVNFPPNPRRTGQVKREIKHFFSQLGIFLILQKLGEPLLFLTRTGESSKMPQPLLAAFFNRQQRPKETVTDYASHLQHLWTKVNKAEDGVMQVPAAILRDAFARGLPSASCTQTRCQARPP